MSLTFKQQVALALLQNLEWMPKFSSMESAAEYLSMDVPQNDADAILVQQRLVAVQVAEMAQEIAKTVGE